MSDLYTERQLERFRHIEIDANWTAYIRQFYPPVAEDKIAVAFDRLTRRYMFVKEASPPFMNSSGFVKERKTLIPFYMWQGPNGEYLPPGPEMGQWFVDHDSFNGKAVGVWDDVYFERMAAKEAAAEDAIWDDMAASLRELASYSRNREQLTNTIVRTGREKPGQRRHFYDGCLR